jgi:hypothetical protein
LYIQREAAKQATLDQQKEVAVTAAAAATAASKEYTEARLQVYSNN